LLWNPANPGSAPQLREAEAVARALGVGVQPFEARTPQEIDAAFAAMTKEQTGALVVLVEAIFTNQARQIARLAAKKHLPSSYGQRHYEEAGSLSAYTPTALHLARRAATFAASSRRGDRADLPPIDQPVKFDLVSNQNPAKGFALPTPPSLLGRADEVIQ